MPQKHKLTQKHEASSRDEFQTPDYATDLLEPFLNELTPFSPTRSFVVWECAAGNGKIVDRLIDYEYELLWTDIKGKGSHHLDFLNDEVPFQFNVIVTNPPFSLKEEFYNRCKWYQKPFALLLPFDMSSWIWNAFKNDGCQGIVPSRRIDYITPSGKKSSAQFHSFWLTYGFNLSNQFEWVELPIEWKKTRI